MFDHSTSSPTDTSYSRSYSTWRPTVSCSVHLREEEGSFDTPAFQLTDLHCGNSKRWLITVPEGHYVVITFESIDLGPAACFLTYVIVRDGPSVSSNVLGTFCEQDTNPRSISSSSRTMLVEINRSWRMLSIPTLNQERLGFKARYRAIRNNTGGLYSIPVFLIAINSNTLLILLPKAYHMKNGYDFCQVENPKITSP